MRDRPRGLPARPTGKPLPRGWAPASLAESCVRGIRKELSLWSKKNQNKTKARNEPAIFSSFLPAASEETPPLAEAPTRREGRGEGAPPPSRARPCGRGAFPRPGGGRKGACPTRVRLRRPRGRVGADGGCCGAEGKHVKSATSS